MSSKKSLSQDNAENAQFALKAAGGPLLLLALRIRQIERRAPELGEILTGASDNLDEVLSYFDAAYQLLSGK